MKLTKLQIEKAIFLAQAWDDLVESTRPPEDAQIGIVLTPKRIGRTSKRIVAIEASQQCQDYKKFLRGLSDQEFRELQAVMFIGRGDYEPTEYQKACDAPGLAPVRELDVSYLIEKTGVGDYFADGFEKLNGSGMI